MTDMKRLRQRLLAAAADPIPVSSIVRSAGGIKEIETLGPANAESELLNNARTVQKDNADKAPPQAIDTKLIKQWVDENIRQPADPE